MKQYEDAPMCPKEPGLKMVKMNVNGVEMWVCSCGARMPITEHRIGPTTLEDRVSALEKQMIRVSLDTEFATDWCDAITTDATELNLRVFELENNKKTKVKKKCTKPAKNRKNGRR